MATSVIVVKIVQSVVKTSLVESIRDGVVDFLIDQVKDLGKGEISKRIEGLRSDAKMLSEIQEAARRAAERWAQDTPDRELVSAVAESTTFTDLPSFQDAMRLAAQNPLSPLPAETLRGKFREVLPARFEAERVERGLAEFFRILQEEFAGAPALREAQAVAAEILAARTLVKIEAHTAALGRIEAILERMSAPPTPQEETLQKYLSWAIDQHRYLDPRGSMQTVRQVQVLLEEVYVSLEAEAEAPLGALDRRLYEGELEAMLGQEDFSPEEKEDLRENLLAKFTREEVRVSSKPEELGVLVKQHPKLVILGDPGAGKTTLLRYLALVHAQALRAGKPEAGDLGPARLPLYLRIASYAEHEGGRSLIDYLPACICGEGEPDSELAGLVQKRLASGACLVLLDGLDEVIEPGQRAEIANQIDLFVRTHERAGNRFIVTSRVAGYRSAPLAGEIPHYRVRDMNGEQIQRFLQQWCHAVERFQTPDLSPEAQAEKAQAEIDGITQAIEKNPGVRRLAANPLLLRTLALIHRTGARLPQRRIELYRLAADTLIRDWELARGIPEKALVREADATRLLSELAAWLHAEKPAGIATEGEVRRKLAEVQGTLLGKESDHPDVLAAVDDFLSRIRQHTGLFVERAPRRYGFMHLTFEEYFAARWLVARPREAARRIRSKLHLPRWEEPILLAIAFYGMEFPEDVDDLIAEAVLGENLVGPSPYEDLLNRDLLFAVRCLGDQDVSVGLMKRLVEKFVKLWHDVEEKGKYGPLRERIVRVMAALLGSQAGVELEAIMLDALHDENENVRSKRVYDIVCKRKNLL